MKKAVFKTKEKVLLAFTGVTLLFIWIHSCMPPELSSDESGWVMKLIEPFLELIVGKGNVTEHLVRKLAHFTEFSALGFELGLISRTDILNNIQNRAARITACCAGGLFTAFCDETIQIFSGRGDSIPDVWLDFSGVVFGMIIACTALLLIKKKRVCEEEK